MNKFLIDHIDPLGQGVFKQDEKVYFIPKTLPGESGEFVINKKSKGVHFGTCLKLTYESPERIEPKCSHFTNCNGCHFLHTSYQNEVSFKLKSFEKILYPLQKQQELPKVEVVSSGERFGYRNRIQLHYDSQKQVLGFKQKHSNDIIPISKCLVASSTIQAKLIELQKNRSWLTLLPPKAPVKGHLELYEKNNEVSLHWNQKYAALGFSQVNQLTNNLLLEKIPQLLPSENLHVLDLFGGEGNLVSNLSTKSSLSVDLYPDGKKKGAFFHLDLFQDNALEIFCREHNQSFNTIILDPPRSGFKQLDEWVKYFQPNDILYVSCQPSTMVRDLGNLLSSYTIDTIYLIEFFPGTYHFEGAIKLNKKFN